MPSRTRFVRELADSSERMSHPDRIRLIEELRSGEKDVNTLAEHLGLPAPRPSRHLTLLRAHRLVAERRDGRHHFHQLVQPEIAAWIVDGLAFLEGRTRAVRDEEIDVARRLWSASAAGGGR